ncbi:heavy metal-associated isoprenylated plant protein 7 isoform X2 [Ziziphus jujuba]|uniref:Heavy metal-associated isoprenylated plant protein 7 isoform X2 n=1 Tax=Ziziphus jujuba TaxID=326968 RepID=A0A6P4A2E8_ZIZJJ|nr:heavy metal-associated isoprenylated plant protein 7 isoform X2 [Ziziphus jujuba]
MGEEEKKPEEKKVEEGKTGEAKKPAGEEKKEKKEEEKPAAEEKKTEESKDGKEDKDKDQSAAPAPPPPPKEIVLKVYMHCEGCARKVKRCLKGFEGVEDVMTDCKTHKVIVKGEKADPIQVRDRVQRKSHRQVELLSPIPKPPSEEEKKPEEKPKAEEKKEEVITVLLKVHMHCEACAQEIRKRILRMKGVESVEADLKGSQVTVKGVFDPPNLVDYVYKRSGKHAVIVKTEPEKKENKEGKEGGGDNNKEEKKGGGGDKDKKGGEGGGEVTEGNKEKKEGDSEAAAQPAAEGEANPPAAAEETKVVELKRNEYSYYPPRYGMEMYASYHAYPPQIFSDENPNACSVM